MSDTLWWLSFAGDEGFRGVILLEAEDWLLAVQKAHALGINPGGEVAGYDAELLRPGTEHLWNRLLSEEDLYANAEVLGQPRRLCELEAELEAAEDE